MTHKWLTAWLPLMVVLAVFIGTSIADDLDDGISKHTDDSISSYDDLGKPDRNINFLKLNAKSHAEVQKEGSGSTDQGSKQTGSGNMNSVVMGAGGTIRGDIYIIDESKGDKTVVVDE